MVALPLAGIRVIEVASWIAGPAAGRILSEWGADVVKIEPLTGDPLRGMGNAARVPGVNPPWDITNAGKQSLAIDLTNPVGRRLALRVIAGADVVISNMRPATAAELGLDYATLSQIAPRLIYCAVTGYGLHGPESERPAYDAAGFWSASGMAALISEGYPSPIYTRPAVGDHSTSVAVAAGICAALAGRERDGEGREVHASLVGTAAYQLSWDYANLEWVGTTAPNPDRSCPPNPLNSHYQCADGSWVVLVGLQSDVMWPRTMRAVGREDLIDEPRFNTTSRRMRNSVELVRILDEAIGAMGPDEVARALDEAGVIWAPLRGAPAVMAADDGVSNIFRATTIDGVPRRVTCGPAQFPGAEQKSGGNVPEIGQDTEELLLDAGVSWDEIVVAKEARAII